ncbi:MAG: hypothetical protein MI864_22170 [Pseudomonadales bacterium]|nr:hypothetical protein [Pseudomonadales bacterium]
MAKLSEQSNCSNIWNLNRDAEIKALLIDLTTRFGDQAFKVEYHTLSHPESVFIYHPQIPEVRAYLYTYGQSAGRYGVHLEHPLALSLDNLFNVYENLNMERLVDILTVHFEITLAEYPGARI